MDRLFLDLSKDARRQTIYNGLLELLDTETRHQVETSPALVSVPEKHHRGLVEVYETIESLQVGDFVKQDMRGIYRILAEAEAEVHGCSVEETHFHEVGNGSSIRNALGICLAIEALDPQIIEATPVQTGSGSVVCAHGVLDIPAPATAAILNQGIPRSTERLEGELCTPTSAAIIRHFVDRFVALEA